MAALRMVASGLTRPFPGDVRRRAMHGLEHGGDRRSGIDVGRGREAHVPPTMMAKCRSGYRQNRFDPTTTSKLCGRRMKFHGRRIHPATRLMSDTWYSALPPPLKRAVHSTMLVSPARW